MRAWYGNSARILWHDEGEFRHFRHKRKKAIVSRFRIFDWDEVHRVVSAMGLDPNWVVFEPETSNEPRTLTPSHKRAR